MRCQITMLLFLGILTAVILSACAGKPDLLPVKPPDSPEVVGFCQQDDQGRLIVTVRNQGNADAPPSTTTVEFTPGGSFPLPTPAIPAGGSVDLSPLSIPAECFDADCEFKITVDSLNKVDESDEGNNSANGRCIG
ncbi:MAG: CARDB domain-containing protein [Candidatus Hodarchaeota archaeon]